MPADCRVTIDIQRFDSVLGEAATLEVLWRVIVTGGGATAAASNGRFAADPRLPAGGQGIRLSMRSLRRADQGKPGAGRAQRNLLDIALM
jgi:hypothetical protein